VAPLASPSAILRAAKAVPGAAQPTPPPQGSPGWAGALSPLARELATANGYASAYGPFLPRPPQDFTQGAFGPFSPILPVPVDSPEDNGRAEPRREQYDVGWNLPVGQPGTEGVGKLASFQTLRTIADLYSVARACIQLRKNEIRGIEWDIVPTTDAAKAMRNSPKQMKDFGERRGQAVAFFRRPDPDYFSWASFIDDALEQMFVFDALSLYVAPKRGKGLRKGLLGSDLDCLQLIDGQTIRPLYDLHGATPRPPAPAYQQYLYGVPRSDFSAVLSGKDIEDAGMTGAQASAWRGDQLLYLPFVRRRWTPYGFTSVERALIPIMSGLQKQGWQLDYFRQGTVPAVYISPGDVSMTPNQIRELQDALNAIAGDPAWHHKIIVLPPGSKTMPQRDVALADAFDEIVRVDTCMGFDVMPMELGIAPKVSTTMSPGACYTDGTEVLTRKGWKLFEDVRAGLDGDEFATRSPKTGEFEWQHATAYHEYDHDGEIIEFSSRDMRLRVTPNHRMLLHAQEPGGKSWEFFREAGEIADRRAAIIPAVSEWKGSGPGTVRFGKYEWAAADFAAFLGAWLAEGSLGRQYNKLRRCESREIVITQTAGSKGFEPYRELLTRMLGREPAYRKSSHSWLFSCSELWHFLDALGHAHIKYIPEDVKNWGAPELQALLDFYLLGDGWQDKGGAHRWRARTASRRLADDLQEVAQKLGGSASITRREPADAVIRGREILAENCVPTYVIGFRFGKTRVLHPARAQYAGKVRCVSVPNTVLYVRSPGDTGVLTAVWCGNSNQMAKMAQSKVDRKSTGPILRFLASVCDYLLRDVCHQDDMRFLFDGLEEEDDEATETGLIVQQVGSALRSVDEGREKLGLQPWGLPETSDPIIVTPTGPVSLQAAMAMAAQPPALPPGGAAPGQPAGQQPGQANGQPPGQNKPANGVPPGQKPTVQGQKPGQKPGQQRDGNAGQTPGHDAAEAAQDSQSANAGASPKAAHAELDALARHLRKGRAISTWQPRHVPAVTLAMISEDLAKGLSVDQAVDVARTITLPPAAYAWIGKEDPGPGPKGWPGWDLDEILAQIYDSRLATAFRTAAEAVQQIAAQWLASAGGALDATVAAIQQAVEDSLGGILQDAWTEGYALGQQAAMAMITETDAADWGTWVPGDVEAAAKVANAQGLSDLLSEYGISAIRSISGTNMGQVAQLLSDAMSGGLSSGTLARQIAGLLNTPGRAQMIAHTEIARASSSATLDRFKAMGVTASEWLIAPSKACPVCIRNAAQGPVKTGSEFRGGVISPPQHPRCRCALTPAEIAGVDITGKSVRVIDLNGQETWRDRRQDDAGGYAAGGSEAGVRPHGADGTQQVIPGGVPGSAAGGEPPRRDGSSPEPRVATVPDDEDDADYPGERGVPPRPGTYWPAPYMDGYWPQGGHGTQQAGTSSPGGHGPRGRPPNGVGKGAADLSDPNPVDAEHVKALMQKNFPEKALGWIDGARWIGPVEVPLDRIDFSNEGSWAASHQQKGVKRFARHIRDGTGHTQPVILVQSPDNPKAIIIDGHHRSLAYRKLGRPVKAYVGMVDAVTPEMLETHSSQISQGAAPANKAAVPGLTSRSGMISLDLPPGTLGPVPGGTDDHHVTVVYLGPDVDDDAFAEACRRTEAAARLVSGPLVAILAGAGSFEPSGGSDGKVPAFVPARIPGAERLRNDLADLSASEHAGWKPHVTLAYLDPGDPLPDPVPPVPVTFTHLTVHRGDDVQRFPLGGQSSEAP